MTINKNHGSIYDKPYTSPDVTQEIGKTEGLKDFEIRVIEEAKTGYGQWYRTKIELEDRVVSGWIKQTDVEEYFNYQVLDTTKIINKNYGSVYDSPYVAGQTKQIENLNDLENEVVEVSAVAETDYGVWVESTYKSKDKSFKGWIKSKDLK